MHKGRFIKILTNRSNEGSTSNIGNENGDSRDGRKRNKNPPAAISVNESRRKKEDNMAVIFMGFIIVFLVLDYVHRYLIISRQPRLLSILETSLRNQ